MTFTSTKEDLFAVLASTNAFILKDWSIPSCYLYAQHNTDYLTMFILYVTSTWGKFPIPLHWLYIYDYMPYLWKFLWYVNFAVTYRYSKKFNPRKFPRLQHWHCDQDFRYMLDDNLHSKHCYTVTS